MSVGCLASPYTFPGRVGIFRNRSLLLGPVDGEGGVLGRGCCVCDGWGGLLVEGPAEGERDCLLILRRGHWYLGGESIEDPGAICPLGGSGTPFCQAGERTGRGGGSGLCGGGSKGAGKIGGSGSCRSESLEKDGGNASGASSLG